MLPKSPPQTRPTSTAGPLHATPNALPADPSYFGINGQVDPSWMPPTLTPEQLAAAKARGIAEMLEMIQAVGPAFREAFHGKDHEARVRQGRRTEIATTIFIDLLAADKTDPHKSAVAAVAYADVLLARLDVPVTTVADTPQNPSPAGG